MSARGSAAASCCSRRWIASSSRPWARCAPPASLTCLLPWWAAKSIRHKERRNEYSIEYRARVSRWCAGRADTATVLVDTARDLGKPCDLHRAFSLSPGLSWKLRDPHHPCTAARARRMAGQSGAAARDPCHPVRNGGCPDHGYGFSCRDLLLSRCVVWRAARSQHPVLEVDAYFRSPRWSLESYGYAGDSAAAL